MRSGLLAFSTLALVLVGSARPTEAAGQWADLTGRMAPEIAFASGFQGGAPGTTLASYRGRAVVLLAFWLRDCPHCKREMPIVQRLYDEYAAFGLQIVSVVHKYSAAEVDPTMRERGWEFPVATDADGSLANAFGGGTRPGFYVVGVDGRVKASNSLPESVVQEELGRLRLHRLGDVPAALDSVRQAVWRNDMAAALKQAETAAKGASPPVGAAQVAERVAALAKAHLDGREWRARRALARGQGDLARKIVAGLGEAYADTSLAARALQCEQSVR